MPHDMPHAVCPELPTPNTGVPAALGVVSQARGGHTNGSVGASELPQALFSLHQLGAQLGNVEKLGNRILADSSNTQKN